METSKISRRVINPGTSIGHVHLKVANIERALGFYRDILGFEVTQWYGDDAVFLSAGGYHHHIGLNTWESAGGSPPPPGTTGLYHTAIRYPTRALLAEALQRLVDAGYPLTGASDHGVSEALYLDDPDGLGVELYWDRPREQWPEPRPGERVGMFTAPLDLEGVLSAGDGELPEAAQGVDVGHVHLKVGDVDTAARFWTDEIGMQEMVRLGDEAAFLADGDYHHHVGVNTWLSRGAGLEPPEGPGLDAVVLAGDCALETRTPDGVRALDEPS